jgi:hypothetical protein
MKRQITVLTLGNKKCETWEKMGRTAMRLWTWPRSLYLNRRRRKERLLTWVLFRNIQSLKLISYIIRNSWVIGLCLSSVFKKTREHNISETGSVSILCWVGDTRTLLGPLERALSKPDDEQSPKIKRFQKPLESTGILQVCECSYAHVLFRVYFTVVLVS